MDSKIPIPPPSSFDNDDAAPPSYSETISGSSTSKIAPTSSTSQYYSSQIQSQLQSITTQITSLETQKSLLSNAQDEKILSLLTLEIQTFLSDFAKTGLRKGTLILVPAKGLEDENAVPMEYDFKVASEYDRVVRVRDKEVDEFREGEMWFWRDEEMAERLAGYLKPAQDPRSAELPARKGDVRPKVAEQTEASGSSRGFWGRKKSSAKSVEKPVIIEARRTEKIESDVKRTVVSTEDKVMMDVKAEEVVFRTENEFGIFGTERGWGVVLKLSVVLGER